MRGEYKYLAHRNRWFNFESTFRIKNLIRCTKVIHACNQCDLMIHGKVNKYKIHKYWQILDENINCSLFEKCIFKNIIGISHFSSFSTQRKYITASSRESPGPKNKVLKTLTSLYDGKSNTTLELESDYHKETNQIHWNV